MQTSSPSTVLISISGIREVGSMTMVTTATEIKTMDGELVCTGYGTLVERGSA